MKVYWITAQYHDRLENYIVYINLYSFHKNVSFWMMNISFTFCYTNNNMWIRSAQSELMHMKLMMKLIAWYHTLSKKFFAYFLSIMNCRIPNDVWQNLEVGFSDFVKLQDTAKGKLIKVTRNVRDFVKDFRIS